MIHVGLVLAIVVISSYVAIRRVMFVSGWWLQLPRLWRVGSWSLPWVCFSSLQSVADSCLATRQFRSSLPKSSSTSFVEDKSENAFPWSYLGDRNWAVDGLLVLLHSSLWTPVFAPRFRAANSMSTAVCALAICDLEISAYLQSML